MSTDLPEPAVRARDGAVHDVHAVADAEEQHEPLVPEGGPDPPAVVVREVPREDAAAAHHGDHAVRGDLLIHRDGRRERRLRLQPDGLARPPFGGLLVDRLLQRLARGRGRVGPGLGAGGQHALGRRLRPRRGLAVQRVVVLTPARLLLLPARHHRHHADTARVLHRFLEVLLRQPCVELAQARRRPGAAEVAGRHRGEVDDRPRLVLRAPLRPDRQVEEPVRAPGPSLVRGPLQHLRERVQPLALRAADVHGPLRHACLRR
mmetsp:Transcript_59079/g.151906  ORF Transcript_59079/g.151906 Transcript_59079/m.151906 type:complete len:262 (+) Transcript_59079:965-1750(+)